MTTRKETNEPARRETARRENRDQSNPKGGDELSTTKTPDQVAAEERAAALGNTPVAERRNDDGSERQFGPDSDALDQFNNVAKQGAVHTETDKGPANQGESGELGEKKG